MIVSTDMTVVYISNLVQGQFGDMLTGLLVCRTPLEIFSKYNKASKWF